MILQTDFHKNIENTLVTLLISQNNNKDVNAVLFLIYHVIY
jgi:hypothetical protein